MSSTKLIVWFTVVLSLSLTSRWRVLNADAERCVLDGRRIVPVYGVDLLENGECSQRFCSIRCASEWPAASPMATWRVHDEVTGAPLDATKACFVESEVITVPGRQEFRHVFENWADAHEHLAGFDGERIPNPLAPPRQNP